MYVGKRMPDAMGHSVEKQHAPKPRQRRRRQADRREESCESILDAAEELFAQRGYHGVTLREIAKASGADTSLLHYYFGTKDALFKAVIERRADMVNNSRMASLDAYDAECGGDYTALGLVSAYLKPTFEFMIKGEPGHLNYGALVAKLNSTVSDPELKIAETPFDGVVHRLVKMMRRVRPDLSDADFYWFYHMMSGSISLSLAQTGRIDVLSSGQCRSDDFVTILEHMTDLYGRALMQMGTGPSGA